MEHLYTSELLNWLDTNSIKRLHLSESEFNEKYQRFYGEFNQFNENNFGINWSELSSNPNSISLLEDRPERTNWRNLSHNPSAIYLLERNRDKIDWNELSSNTSAIDLITKEIRPQTCCYYCWKTTYFKGDKSVSVPKVNVYPKVTHLIKPNMKAIGWGALSSNTNAIEILKLNPEKINWASLSSKTNAIEILERNPEKINWACLSSNQNAIHLLSTHSII